MLRGVFFKFQFLSVATMSCVSLVEPFYLLLTECHGRPRSSQIDEQAIYQEYYKEYKVCVFVLLFLPNGNLALSN
jgi:hypothetical protein